MGMKSFDEVRDILVGCKEDLCRRYRVRGIELFGSYVRGEQKRESDIDLLVDFEEDADLFDLTGLALFLEEKLGERVDVISKRALRKEIREGVLKEVVSV